MKFRSTALGVLLVVLSSCKQSPKLATEDTVDTTPLPVITSSPAPIAPDTSKVKAQVTVNMALATAGVKVRCEVKDAKRADKEIPLRKISWYIGKKGRAPEVIVNQDLKAGDTSAEILLDDKPSQYENDLWCAASFVGLEDSVQEPIRSVNSARILPPGGVLAAGSEHTCLITADRGVKCWGRNNLGQMGNGTTAAGGAQPPGDVKFSKDTLGFLVDGFEVNPGRAVAVSIAAGGDHTCVTLSNNTVQCWGSNSDSQLGNTKKGVAESRPMPDRVSFPLDSVVANPLVGTPEKEGLFPAQIAVGNRHSCTEFSNGNISCWGHNFYSQSNGKDKKEVAKPSLVEIVAGAKLVKTGQWNTCATVMQPDAKDPSKTKTVTKCWGKSAGNVPPPKKKVAVSFQAMSFYRATEAASDNGSVKLDAPSYEFSDSEGRWVVDVATGFDHACVLYSAPNEALDKPNYAARKVVCQGKNNRRQLGLIALEGGRSLPPGFSLVRLEGSENEDDLWEAQFPMPAVRISAGSEHTCTIYKKDPNADAFKHGGVEANAPLGVACWGDSTYSQHPVDDAHLWRVSTKIFVVDGILKDASESMQELVSGDGHICTTVQKPSADSSLPLSTRVVCWGNNSSGQAVPPNKSGDPIPGNGRVGEPVEVTKQQNEPDSTDAIGDENGVCTLSDGQANDPLNSKRPNTCWGFNGNGRLFFTSPGNVPSRVTPVPFVAPQATMGGNVRPTVGLKGMGWGRICTWRDGEFDYLHNADHVLVCKGEFKDSSSILVRVPQWSVSNDSRMHLTPHALAVNENAVCVTTEATAGENSRVSGPFLWCGDFAQAARPAGGNGDPILDLVNKSGDIAAALSLEGLDSRFDSGKLTAGRRFFCYAPPPIASGELFSSPVCWGENGMGQITGTPTQDRQQDKLLQRGLVPKVWSMVASVLQPTQSAQMIVLDISSGENHTCALFNGRFNFQMPFDQYVLCWGDNSLGQFAHTTDFCGRVSSDQEAFCRGTSFGLFYHAPKDPSPLFATPKNADGVTMPYMLAKIASGSQHTCVLTSGLQRQQPTAVAAPPERPEMFCWGDNRSGQLGLLWVSDADLGTGSRVPLSESQVLWPTHVTWDVKPRPLQRGQSWNPLGFVLLPGRAHTCLLEARNLDDSRSRTRNAVYCWGDNAFFQTSKGYTPQQNGYVGPNVPTTVPGF